MAPLQLGLGVQLHRQFEHGVCCSYAEVCKFEHSAAVYPSTALPSLPSESFIQYSADNVDHNLCTIDGHNRFHGMGMIVM